MTEKIQKLAEGFEYDDITNHPGKGKGAIYEYADFYYRDLLGGDTSLGGLDAKTAAFYIDSQLIPKLDIYNEEPWVIQLTEKRQVDAKDAIVYSVGHLDDWDKMKTVRMFWVTGDRKVMGTQKKIAFVKDLPKDINVPEKPEVGGFSMDNTDVKLYYSYPDYTLAIPDPEPEINGYPVSLAAAELNAALLSDVKDDGWKIVYSGKENIDGKQLFCFKLSNHKTTFKALVSSDHKLYRYEGGLEVVGEIPKDIEEMEVVETHDSIPSFGHGYDRELDGKYVSVALASHWVRKLTVKTYQGKRDNSPWHVELKGTKKLKGIEGYSFDIGQGMHGLDKVYMNAIVTQDRKVYRVQDGKTQLVGTIPEDAPEIR